MNLRSYKKNKISDYLSRTLIIIILSLLASTLVIRYFSHKANDILFPMAEAKLRKIVTTLINESTNDILFDKELLNINKDEENNIDLITYNTYEVTKLINTVTGNIEARLEKMYLNDTNGEKLNTYLLEEVPFGAIYSSSFLSGLGPRIKLRAEMTGSMVSNIETEVKPYGINNAYIETRIFLEVSAKIYLPFVTKDVKISNVIPISMNIVQGKVPSGYIVSYK